MDLGKQTRNTPHPQDRARQAAAMLDDHRAGSTFREIARKHGVALGTVHNRLHEALHEIRFPAVEEYRKVEAEKLDKLWAALWPRGLEGSTPAILALLKLSERRAKLLGLDVPVKTDVTVTTQDPVDAELQALITAAQAQNRAVIERVRGDNDHG